MHAALGVALALGAAAVAPAGMTAAQPADGGGAEQTIERLEAEGYDVIVDRVGNGDIGQCEVIDVRHPQTLTQTIVTGHDRNRDVVTVVVSKTIHVTIDCKT